MTEIFVGTSGWSYDWNKGNSLDWYVEESGLTAIELNMSYYRFPFPNMVKSWARKGKSLAWIIKVNRSITHYRKLTESTYSSFKKFMVRFKPLEEYIHYYLLQLPPEFNDLTVVQAFVDEFKDVRLAIEFRDRSLFTEEIKEWGEENGVLIVSVDAPDLPATIMSESVIYERVHGRSAWYSHDYSEEELKEIKERVLTERSERVYVFFNNDHAMLRNARMMLNLLTSGLS